jgi:riboflavin synthase
VFTGLVREVGTVAALDRDERGARLRVEADLAGALAPGDSVAVAGACLTVAERSEAAFEADAINQTLSLTTLGELRPGDRVNLEPALRAGDPLGGHLVQGHVDAVGTVRERAPLPDGSTRMAFAAPDAVLRYVVEKGSIAVDGISLTVAAVGADAFEIAVIPHTLAVTTLGARRPGDPVNLEVDVVAKYVERLLVTRSTE